ncbi:MAG: dNTP triphosphohydrolase [Mesorhizobium sp.]|uniref:dGTP triphosphohydrolase n=1 Tax=Mesorhizobium sp. TaxID=1871066 RepID=UPI000FE710E3|nr:dNTP triphosphohydrolase [Mesorhizobium sp.]RWB77192.1 MAG: dNTP triphosphohydrolase [Mesorhizobium sp.]
MGGMYRDSDRDRIGVVGKSSDEPFRSEWRRDIARLIHCPAFRRLQGKPQVFPGGDSDFFRNRLTHSLEVAQIAKSIAIRLNYESDLFKEKTLKIEPEIVEFAGLAHDLGHPPFGHNGEEALDHEMEDQGGFEGNAQTLHILAKVEKKEYTDPEAAGLHGPIGNSVDYRAGLNLTYRSLASILKYDHEIPARAAQRRSGYDDNKGYYQDESRLVADIKKSVLGQKHEGPFKTIECSIMDISDDIAYSTYDIEDCFKAGILSPIGMFSLDDKIYESAIKTINKRMKKYYGDINAIENLFVDRRAIQQILFDLFSELFIISQEERSFLAGRNASREHKKQTSALLVERFSNKLASDGYERVKLTSRLVQIFMDGVEVVAHATFPQLHRARLKLDTFKKVEVLKNITYEHVIMSPAMQTIEYRGKEIISAIFNAVDRDDKKGKMLLPEDYRGLYEATRGPARKRILADFIAGMTDRYAWEFYNRICGTNAASVFRKV